MKFNIYKIEIFDANRKITIESYKYGNYTTEIIEYNINNVLIKCFYIEDKNGDILLDEYDNVPIKLKENKEYSITYESSDDITNIIENISYNQSFARIKRRDNLINFDFNSKNYIGILNTEIFNIDNKLIEIVSEKIDHEYSYNIMISDINECFTELLSRSGSIYESSRNFTNILNERETNYYSRYIYIKNILNKYNAIMWVAYLEKHANSKLECQKEEKFIAEVDDIEIDDFISSLNYDNIFKMNEKMYLKMINKTFYEEVKDTNENRFVKFFIEYIDMELLKIYENVTGELKEDVNNTRLAIQNVKKSSFFNNIGNLTQIPYNSQILQKKYPYNNFFRAFNNLRLISMIENNLTENTFLVGQKDMPNLYEYWCFIKIFRVLLEKYNFDKNNHDWIRFDESTLNVNIIRGCCSIFGINENTYLKLYYNKNYNNVEKENETKSYSQIYKPDISVEIYINNQITDIIHFDAKYKVPDDNKNFKEDDLSKMHAYKDAILLTSGAFLLTLGKESEFFNKENELASVGTISFIPGYEKMNDIEKRINEFIQKNMKTKEVKK